MKNETLFHKSIGILVDAYFNDTLVHNNCAACAVGNLIAGNLGYEFKHSEEKGGKLAWSSELKPIWYQVHCATQNAGDILRPEEYKGLAKEQIDSTGYSFIETSRIEIAFERCEKGNNDDEYMFNGLMAVVDVLIEIHEGNEEEKIIAKNKFVKIA